MFDFLKKKERQIIAEEETGLKEFISVDSMKAHLVDILEENRRLKKQAEDRAEMNSRNSERERKKTEVALIEADEWKRRAQEKDEKIAGLEKVVEDQKREIEKLTTRINDLIVGAEMEKKEAERQQEKKKKGGAENGNSN